MLLVNACCGFKLLKEKAGLARFSVFSPAKQKTSTMHLNDEALLKHHRCSLDFHDKLRACKDEYISHHVNTALDVLSDALRLYGPQHLLSSYNGGKDADVTMHLLRAAVAKYSANAGVIRRPKLVYFAVEDDFPEVIEYITYAESLFDLKVQRYDCGIVEVRLLLNVTKKILVKYSFPTQGIKRHSDECEVPGVPPAFVMGSRKADPNCESLETFSPSRFVYNAIANEPAMLN